MATIDQLMQSNTPGSIRIAASTWKDEQWFTPYFTNKYRWWGLDNTGNSVMYSALGEDWQPWRKPIQKHKKWLWAYRDLEDGSWRMSQAYMDSCEAISAFCRHEHAPIKLEWSELEVDE